MKLQIKTLQDADPELAGDLEKAFGEVGFAKMGEILKLNEVVSEGWKSLKGVSKNAKWVSVKQGDKGVGLRNHFGKHGDQVGVKSSREFDLSSRLTINNGRKFKYRDPSSNQIRIGYWDKSTGFSLAQVKQGVSQQL